MNICLIIFNPRVSLGFTYSCDTSRERFWIFYYNWRCLYLCLNRTGIARTRAGDRSRPEVYMLQRSTTRRPKNVWKLFMAKAGRNFWNTLYLQKKPMITLKYAMLQESLQVRWENRPKFRAFLWGDHCDLQRTFQISVSENHSNQFVYM